MSEIGNHDNLTSNSPPPGQAMPAEFGLGTATFLVVASMVGVGVLTTSGYTVALVGSNQWMLILWVLGGLIAVSGAMSLAELSAMLPRTGGDYVYLHEAYGPLPAFLSGWVSFLIGFSCPTAAAAYGSAKYLRAPFVGSGAGTMMLEKGIASALILGFWMIHVRGRSASSRVQGVITLFKLGVLVLFAIVGLAVGFPRYENLLDRTPLTLSLVVIMLSSMVYISYAYVGWNAASYLAGEIKNPEKLLPRAILIGTGGVVALYLFLNIVYGLALSASDVRGIISDPANTQGFDAVAPIAELAAKRLFGPGASAAFSVVVGLMLFSTLSAYILVGPRVVYAMAAAGQFPAVAARLTRDTKTPAVATALQTSAALVLLWTGSYESLVVYASVGLSIFSMLSISSIYVLRRRRPELDRPFRCPLYPITPALFLIPTALLVVAVYYERPLVSTYALASILAGVPVYYLGGFSGRSRGGATATTL